MPEDRKIELLRKIRVLAERGDRGERIAAQAQLERLMKKYGVHEADLSNEALGIHWFKVSGKYEKKLLYQIAFKIRSTYNAYTHRAGPGKRSELGIECTDAEALQIQIELEFFSRLLDEEFDLFYLAFLHKHHIFPDDPPPNEGNKNLTRDQIVRMAAMINGMQDATLRKMISDH